MKHNVWFDYRKNCMPGAVTCFIGVIDEFRLDEEIFRFLDMLLRRSVEIVCTVYVDRDWKELLGDRYYLKVIPYPDKPFVVLTMKQKLA